MFARALALFALTLPAVAQQTTSFCHAFQVACPCASQSGEPGGCANSASVSGASLIAEPDWAADAPSVSNDAVVLMVEHLPLGTSVLFCQGTAQITPTPFGDGVRCMGGTVMRLALRHAQPGQGWVSYPYNGEPAISAIGNVPASGGPRFYQAWYRNAVQFCTSATFNMSNMLRINWLP